MNFDDTPAEAAFRREVRAFLDAHAPRHLERELRDAPLFSLELSVPDPLAAARAWQAAKFAGGWACPRWPKELGGRAATPIEAVIWSQEEAHYAKLSLPFSIGIGMAGPTLLRYGSEEMRRRHLPRIASGEEIWCQLFSEPGAGSDLAAVATRAERSAGHPDEWRVTGQKVWTSWARESDFGLLLARTDVRAPKHDGLTMFVIDMRQPGVEIRPIRQMNGKSVFNEVYLTEARVPDAYRLTEVGGGWRGALTTLMNERVSASKITTGFEQLFALCRARTGADGETRLLDDPALRARLARWAVTASGLRFTGYRSLTSLSRGVDPGPEGSIGKLAAASTLQDITRFALDLLGPGSLVVGDEGPPEARWFQQMFLRSPGLRIEAGSDEILRTVIGERVLGMPGEPRVDKGVPFAETGGRPSST